MAKQKLIAGPIRGYKGTDEDMCCHDFQFKTGENVLKNNKDLKLCENGFHFCQQPSGVFVYNNYARLWAIEAYDVLDTEFSPGVDYKQVCRKIVFVKEIEIDGDGNTGDWNTGHGNTGYGNTGDGNATNKSAGYFCVKEPPLVMFDRPAKEPFDDWVLVRKLADCLSSDKPFDCKPFLKLPNATEKRIKKLHTAHIEGRKKAVEK